MSGTASVSVVILNRDRLGALHRALLGLRLQSRRDFELVIVSNQPARIREEIPLTARARIVACPDANISRARNIGIMAAGGDIIAFCDDDAVPECYWLERLTAALSDPGVGAAGGLVRGRNGVSIQWGAQEIDSFGNDWPSTGVPEAGRVLKTVGTNSAYRRAALEDVGGFDEAYRFFLDETDVNWRLAQAGWSSVHVPEAEVHHQYARSMYRSRERAPKSLFEIGASKQYFCRRHGAGSDLVPELDGFRDAQRRRLLKSFDLGLIAPGDVGPLMRTLEAGFLDGHARQPELGLEPGRRGDGGAVFADGPMPEARLLTTSRFSRSRRRAEAKELADAGALVTLFDFSRTTRMLTVRMTDDGYWLHRGGVYGKGNRDEPAIQLRTFSGRIRAEAARIAQKRPI